MHTTASRPQLVVSADGHGVVSHAGSRLLADLADATGLTTAFHQRAAPPAATRHRHAPGRIAVDMAVMLADGGEAIRYLSVLRDQPAVFGPVASTPTALRLLAGIDSRTLAALQAARATAREVAWLQAAETRAGVLPARAAGRDLAGLVLDIDATLVTCHSEKEQAAATDKHGFGFHPLPCFLDNTGEALAGLLRPGNAGANSATDHITVLDQALAQIPDAHRHGTDILIRTDTAGGAKAFLHHIRSRRTRGIRTFFSVGHPITGPVRRAIRALPDQVWHPALDQDGSLRAGAQVAELTDMIDLAGYPDGTRIIVRRERPHPGARLSLFDLDEGVRRQVFLTDTPHTGGGTTQYLEARHRAHARVDDRIRSGKSTGFGRFPSRHFTINAAWLELALAATDLVAWTRTLLLEGELATAEPKKLRHRILHAAARITRGGRRLRLRIATTWPWRNELTSAFARLVALPRPAT